MQQVKPDRPIESVSPVWGSAPAARLQRLVKTYARASAVTILLFVIMESAIRTSYWVRNSRLDYIALPYVVSDNYGPIPPWVDGLRILEPDDVLIWKLRPSVHRKYMDVFSPAHVAEDRQALLHRFRPTLPTSLKRNPVWEISLNSAGFRDREFSAEKRPSAFRIVCLGDSWTFGANVGQEQAYPQRLGSLFRQKFPGADCEVLNLGVLGYSSYQGLELLKRQALDLEPAVVVIGFAMNDAAVPGYRDKDLRGLSSRPIVRMGRALDKIESFKLLRYEALRMIARSSSMSRQLQSVANSVGTESEVQYGGAALERADYDKLELQTRVSPRDYEKNLRDMIRLARNHHADAILLYNQLWNTRYRTVLEKLSREERVPLVDSRSLVVTARRQMETSLEQKLELRPPIAPRRAGSGEVEVVFRVRAGQYPVPRAMYIVGAHAKLGDCVPNKVVMYDDGTHGDQRAGDGVWSYSATFPVGSRIFYVYTNSGEPGRWEGLDVPEIRRYTVEPANHEATIYRPIETFGQMYLQADAWHTNAAGYELIARAVLKVLEQNPRLKDHLHHSAPAGPEYHPVERAL